MTRGKSPQQNLKRSALESYAGYGQASSVVSRIGLDIVSGLHPADARLPDEDAMRTRYAVSRTALREAYSKLTAKGLLTAKPKVGTSVKARADWNMLDPEVLGWHLQTLPASEIASDLYAVRRMVEPGAAALAALNHNEDDIAQVEKALADMQAASGDEHALVEADFRFHTAILTATQNPFINAFSGLIHAAMVSTFELSWRAAEAETETEDRLAQHGDVLAAIKAGDCERARATMEKLLNASIHDLREALAET